VRELALTPFLVRTHIYGRYATTIHAINSGVLKLKALTVVQRVYRGIAGLRLPESFFHKNAHNIAGGVEYGFSSTTLEPETALNYAKVKSVDQASTVLEAEMGMVDRGADISPYSQFPGCAHSNCGGTLHSDSGRTLHEACADTVERARGAGSGRCCTTRSQVWRCAILVWMARRSWFR
jgi:hypothetical protein